MTRKQETERTYYKKSEKKLKDELNKADHIRKVKLAELTLLRGQVATAESDKSALAAKFSLVQEQVQIRADEVKMLRIKLESMKLNAVGGVDPVAYEQQRQEVAKYKKKCQQLEKELKTKEHQLKKAQQASTEDGKKKKRGR